MSTIEKDDVIFSADDDELQGDYVALSRLAIASMIVGLFSFVALAHLLLIFFSIVAALIAIAALVAIARNDGAVSGRGLAVAAMTLAAISGSWSGSVFLSADFAIFREAKSHADSWLEMIEQGNLYAAYELHLEYQERKPPQTNLEGVYGEITEATFSEEAVDSENPHENVSDSRQFRAFWSSSPRREMAKYRKTAKVTFERKGVRRDYTDLGSVSVDELPLIYRVDYEEKGEKKSIRFVVTMDRFNFTSRREWTVSKCYEVKDSF